MKGKHRGCIPRAQTFCPDDGSAVVHMRPGDGWWKVVRMLPPLPSSSTPFHITATGPDNTAVYNFTITASAAISTVFCLSLSYQKWHVQQWLGVGGVNGAS